VSRRKLLFFELQQSLCPSHRLYHSLPSLEEFISCFYRPSKGKRKTDGLVNKRTPDEIENDACG